MNKEAIGLLALTLSAAAEDYKTKLKGDKGDKGDRGEKGDKGDRGPVGKEGYTPRKGVDFRDGLDGKDGCDGRDGLTPEIPADLIRQSVKFILDSEGEKLRGPEGKAGPSGIPGMRMRGEWKFGEKYSEGDLVALGGDIWYAGDSGPESKPGKGTKWKLFLRSQAGRISGYGVVQGQGGAGITSLTIGSTPITGGSAYRLLSVDSTGALLQQNAALTATRVLFVDGNGQPTDSANLAFDGTTLSTTRLGVAAGTLTTDVQIANFSATWNAAGVTFEGLRVTITDTASAAGSLAMQILGGASGTTNLLSVDKLGASRSESFYAIGGTFGCRASTATLSAVYMIDAGSSVGLIGFTSNTASGVFWANSSNDAGQAKDTGLTRISAGLIGVGTGGAGSFAGSLKLTDLDAVGDVDAVTYHVNGAAGADFGPGMPTSITVVKGIITAIS